MVRQELRGTISDAQALKGRLDISVMGGIYLPLNGGTMKGDIILANDPTNEMHATTKRYVDRTIDEERPNTLSNFDILHIMGGI